jgi:hypothetical protein
MTTLNIIIISYLIASISGVLLHFTHKTFKKGMLLHFVSAVNESVWEHMKLAFYPMLVIILGHSFISNFMFDGFAGIAFISIIIGTFSIPVLYGLMQYIIKKEIVFLSIGLYFVCIFLGFYSEYALVNAKFVVIPDIWAISGLIILMCGFAYFTYFPLKHNIFRDPIHNKYGEFKQKFDK